MDSYHIPPSLSNPEETRQKWQKERDESFVKHLLQRIRGAQDKATQDGKTLLVTTYHPTVGPLNLFSKEFAVRRTRQHKMARPCL